jgi:hypothetical protein
MIKYENECCGCATPNYPCIGESCPNRRVPHRYCDECGEEDTLYEYDGEELCIECIKERLEEVKGE